MGSTPPAAEENISRVVPSSSAVHIWSVAPSSPAQVMRVASGDHCGAELAVGSASGSTSTEEISSRGVPSVSAVQISSVAVPPTSNPDQVIRVPSGDHSGVALSVGSVPPAIVESSMRLHRDSQRSGLLT